MTLADYVQILRRRWRLIAICAAVGMFIGIPLSTRIGAGYTSTASVLIQPITSDPFNVARLNESVSADTEKGIVTSTVVAELAAKALGKDDPEKLLSKVDVQNPLDTLILEIEYKAATPQAAQNGAQAFAEAYLEYRQKQAEATKKARTDQLSIQLEQLQTELSSTIDAVNAATVSSAEHTRAVTRQNALIERIAIVEQDLASQAGLDTTPGRVIQPAELPSGGIFKKVTIVLATAILGAVVGVVTSIVLDRFDRFMRDEREFSKIMGSPPLAVIPQVDLKGLPETPFKGSVALSAPDSPAAFAYRKLRVQLWPHRADQAGRHDGTVRRLLITGANASQPAMHVALNLSVALAHAGGDVALVWADMESNSFRRHFADEPAADLIDVASGSMPLEKAILDFDEIKSLHVIPGNLTSRSASGVLASPAMMYVLEDVALEHDHLIVMSPPVLRFANALEVAGITEGSLLCVDPAVDTRRDIVDAYNMLAQVFSKIVGVVVDPKPRQW
ncbi:MAG: hypothetical protein IT195_00190 [Microthrixaceae bacterium]|nr:hypothetical protein [Microthrixaceae bacterium]